jgi:hypothetical protein
MIEEQAEASEELIAALTKNHTCQIETHINSTTEAIKEMISLIKNNQKAPNSKPNNGKKKRQKRKAQEV